jgi:hypothetical protein
MLTLHPQFIKDSTGNRSLVVLTAEEFDAIMEELNDLEDVQLHDKAKKNYTGEQIPLKDVLLMTEEKKTILENIKAGLEEVKLFKKGKLKTTPANDFLNEL